jgi:hypothetical protein
MAGLVPQGGKRRKWFCGSGFSGCRWPARRAALLEPSGALREE